VCAAWQFVSEYPTAVRVAAESLVGSHRMGDGRILYKKFLASLCSKRLSNVAGSLSLNSTRERDGGQEKHSVAHVKSRFHYTASFFMGWLLFLDSLLTVLYTLKDTQLLSHLNTSPILQLQAAGNLRVLFGVCNS
jgi:hypothetical protein